ncbi:hypothetical protein ACAG96_07515 [Candidatus Izemoplasma sp. B36]|uniref:hypothetical protein n=1 Tax=Candidatus Izemoplasma sp. B36 TaxID=3242468 RepID=UPI0035571BB2
MDKKVKNIITAVVTIAIFIFVGLMLISSFRGPEISIIESENLLDIDALFYSKEIEINETVNISLVSPKEILRKTNGAAIGDVKSGYFTIEGDLPVYLNLGDATADWIEIIDGEDYYYINLKTEIDTIDLYNNLIDMLD